MADFMNQSTAPHNSSIGTQLSRILKAIARPPTFGDDTAKTKIAALIDRAIKLGILITAICPLLLFAVVPSLGIMLGVNSGVIVLCLLALWLNARGHVRSAGSILTGIVIGAVFIDTVSNSTSISPATGILIPIIATAGFAFGFRGLFISAFVCVVTMGVALLIRLGASITAAEHAMLIYEYSVHMVVLLVSGVGLSISVRYLQQAQQHSRQSESALAERNRELEREIVVRRQAEQRQEQMALSMREVIDAANELLSYEDMDSLWCRAVELARERLGLERCGIFLIDYEARQALGTYGTDIYGQVISERNVSFSWSADDIAWLQGTPTRGTAEWVIAPLAEHHSHSGEGGRGLAVVGHGWGGKIAIRSRRGPAMAALFCDAAISGRPLDPAQLDLVAVYCSLLGNIAERRQLTAKVTARTHELTQLLDISQTISSTLDLKLLLTQLFAKLKAVIHCDGILVSEFINGHDTRIVAYSDELDQKWVGHISHMNAETDAHILELINTRRPIIIPDIHADTVHAQAFRTRLQRTMGEVPSHIASVMYLPLVVRDRIIGYMRLTFATCHDLEKPSMPMSLAFANQAAILMAITRAHHEGIQSAALSERARIARELHDSVSQALYGIVLGVRTTMQYVQAKANPLPSLDYTLTLSEAALNEIRALIFELRPEYLEKEGLIAALRKQTEALCQRNQIDAQITIQADEPNLPLSAKETVYRIGLEALQNTLKHAKATRIELTIADQRSAFQVEMKDNGKGFDPDADFGDHYGLVNMRERAAQFGAVLHINSQPNQGTTVLLQMPLA